MPEFTHFLSTRFNVRIGVADARVIEPTWLEERFALFDRFCFPSVRAQTNPHFHWLVFFDPQTPATFREKVAVYARWPNFVPCFDGLPTPKVVKERIEARVDRPAEYVITTRLDDDDALALRFVDGVQDRFARQPFTFLNFTRGYLWAKGKLYEALRPSSPFLSLIESRTGMRTVWCRNHMQVAEVGPLVEVDTEPMWIQVVHGGNRCNRRADCVRTPLRRLNGAFPLDHAHATDENGLSLRVERGSNRLAARPWLRAAWDAVRR